MGGSRKSGSIAVAAIVFLLASSVNAGVVGISSEYVNPMPIAYSGAPITDELLTPLFFVPGQAGLGQFPNPPAAKTFDNRWWSEADVGTTLWISSGPEFEVARALLTNGVPDTIAWGFNLRRTDGSVWQATNNPGFYTLEHLEAGSNGMNGIDLAGFEVERIGVQLRSISISKAPEFGDSAIWLSWHVAAVADVIPIPEPSGLVGAPALALLLGSRRRPSVRAP